TCPPRLGRLLALLLALGCSLGSVGRTAAEEAPWTIGSQVGGLRVWGEAHRRSHPFADERAGAAGARIRHGVAIRPAAPWLLIASGKQPASGPHRGEQRPGRLPVRRVKTFGEPVIDGRQQLVGGGLLPLALPEARQAHGSAQL